MVGDDALVVVERQHTRHRRRPPLTVLGARVREVRERDDGPDADDFAHLRRPLHELLGEPLFGGAQRVVVMFVGALLEYATTELAATTVRLGDAPLPDGDGPAPIVSKTTPDA